MTLDQQIASIEDRVTLLEAAIDGSEVQTREATAYLVGLVSRFLHEKGLINENALARYVAAFDGDPKDRDDYLGDLVRLFSSNLIYHERHPGDFRLSPRDTASENDR